MAKAMLHIRQLSALVSLVASLGIRAQLRFILWRLIQPSTDVCWLHVAPTKVFMADLHVQEC